MKFTIPQKQAIDITGRSVLVSAAAGSGKTAVITERVIKKLTDSDNPVMADKLVIVTYTVASAAELRERIYNALLEKINIDPTNKLLSHQLILLEKAKISTIHSLCSDIIKDNFYSLGLTSTYKMIDENELAITITQTIEDYFEDQYQSDNTDFIELVDFFCESNDTPLVELVQKIYSYIRSFAQPFAWLDTQLEKFNNISSFSDYIYRQDIKQMIYSRLRAAANLYKTALYDMQDDNALFPAYSPAFQSELAVIDEAISYISDNNFDEFSYTLLNFVPVRLTAVRGYADKDFLNKVKAKRDEAKKIIDKLCNTLVFTNDEFVTQSNILYKHTKTLFDIVKHISSEVDRQKLEKNCVDFSDLEHFALKVLTKTDENNHLVKSDYAKLLCLTYDEIMVDECQDINDVQNTIFNMLSNNENNIFMVGDIKQSIYRFRKAMPQIFIQKRENQPLYDPASPDKTSPVSILLKNNFRSREEVTNCVNHLFNQIMCTHVGEVTYDEDERLIPSATYPDYPDATAELHIVSQEYLKEDITPMTEQPDNNDGNDTLDTTRTAVDANYVATLIYNMVRDKYMVTDKKSCTLRPCSYNDFAILLRSTKNKSEVYTKELNKLGIDAFCNTTTGYFGTNEVGLMLSLLKIIDNPVKDYDMLCVMLSPIFMYSPDEIVDVRLVNKYESLYKNLLIMSQAGNEKATHTISLISKFRQDLSICSIDRLIESIYETTDIVAIMEATNFGSQKGVNLLLLLDYARIYEETSSGGLVGFLRYIDRCIEQNKDFESANTISQTADVVKIITIHSTKGLEYPICILADCTKKFNMMDLNNRYQLNSQYGFAMNYKHSTDVTYSDIKTIHSHVIMEKSRLELISEEQRLLYVAMTRAKEKLIMIVTTKDSTKLLDKYEDLLSNENLSSVTFSSSLLSCATSYCDWIVPSFLIKTDLYDIKLVLANPILAEETLDETNTYVPFDPAISDKLTTLFNLKYPHQALTDIVAKATVTSIAKSQGQQLESLIELPNFMDEQDTSASEKGTALHAFMQFCNFDSINFDVQTELERLEKDKFLTSKQCSLVDVQKVNLFLQSALFKRMAHSNKVLKEYSFIYEIPVNEVYTDTNINTHTDEKIVIQGISDCIFFEGDSIVIVDYKTDKTHDTSVLIERYYNQMNYYKQAIERVFNLPVSECIIYSLEMNQEIPVLV